MAPERQAAQIPLPSNQFFNNNSSEVNPLPPPPGNPNNAAAFINMVLNSGIALVERQLADQQQQLSKATDLLCRLAEQAVDG